MPQRRNAVKALRQAQKRHLHNNKVRKDLKKAVKKFIALVNQKNKTEAQSILKILYKKFDKAAKRHLIHKNTAARRKARFARLITSIN